MLNSSKISKMAQDLAQKEKEVAEIKSFLDLMGEREGQRLQELKEEQLDFISSNFASQSR